MTKVEKLNQTNKKSKIDVIFSDDRNMPHPDKYPPLNEEQQRALDKKLDKIATRFGI